MKKSLLTYLSLAVLLLSSVQSVAQESSHEPVVCATKVRSAEEALNEFRNGEQEAQLSDAVYFTDSLKSESVALRCESLNRVRGYLQAINYGLQFGLALSACAVVAAPPTAPVSATATAFIGLGSATLTVIDFELSYLPCEEVKKEDDMKKVIQEQICIELEKNGIKCDHEVKEISLP